MLKIIDSVPYIGIVIIVIGMLAGFTYLFMGADDTAKYFLGMIPVGFLILFVGVVTNMLRR
ncbi:MAG: hypothetical protein OEY11_02125 [Gammaproteobacteria bacterium]|nr:hypothetical protein [Gammaproteobacteria bacterium]